MKVEHLIARLRQMQVKIELAGAQLKIMNLGTGAIPAELLEEIRINKPLIVDFIRNSYAQQEQFLSIPVLVNETGEYEVSGAQKRLLVLAEMDDALVAYNACSAKLLTGRLHLDVLQQAFLELIRKHEILRTVFITAEESFKQKVIDFNAVDFRVDYYDLREEPLRKEKIDEYYKQVAETAFDVTRLPLFRVTVLQTGEQEYVLIFCNHHIIFDGWSQKILVRELYACYNLLCAGITPVQEPLRIQYKDYAAWHNALMAGDSLEPSKQFWLQLYSEPAPVLNLPLDFKRPAIKTYRGSKCRFALEPSLVLMLAKKSKKNNVTFFTTLISAVQVLLYKYTAQQDVVIGIDIADRPHTDLENQLGFYVNTLPLRLGIAAGDSLDGLLQKNGKLAIDAFSHQHYPFDKLVEELPLKRDPARNPLFDVLVSFNDNSESNAYTENKLTGITVWDYKEDVYAVKFDLEFSFHKEADNFFFNIEFNTDLFVPDKVQQMGKHLEYLLSCIAGNTTQSIADIDLPGQSAYPLLIDDINHAATNGVEVYMPPASELEEKLTALFERVLDKRPIGVSDNFFDMGGDSIKAIRLVAALNKSLNTRLRAKNIFSNQTIRELAGYLHNQQQDDQLREKEIIKQELEQLKKDMLQQQLPGYPVMDSVEDVFPMSDIQKGMLYHSLLDNASGVYHNQVYYQFEDVLFDVSLFERAFFAVQEKHPALRTGFLFTEGYELQIVHKASVQQPDISLEDISDMNQESQREYLSRYLIKDRENQFEVSKPGLWRVRLFRLSGNEYGILFVIHHAITDGWSIALLMTELFDIYYTLKQQRTWQPVPLKTSYKEYVIDQLWNKKAPGELAFWKNYLEGYEKTGLPFGNRRLTNTAVTISAYTFRPVVPGSVVAEKLKSGNAKKFHLATFCQLIRLLTNQQDIVIGKVTNGRPETEDGDKLFGCFLNTVPFRVNRAFENNNRDYVSAIDVLLTESAQHDRLSLLEISNVVKHHYGHSDALFDITFDYQDFYIYDHLHPLFQLKKPLVEGYGKSDTLFNLVVEHSGDSCDVIITYPTGWYTSHELNVFERYYRTILHNLVMRPDDVTGYDCLLTQEDRNKLLYDFNATRAAYANDKTVVELFEEQAGRAKENTAVVFGEKAITYEVLNFTINRVAGMLRQNYCIQPNDVVGLMLNRSEYMLVSMLGVLKAGGCFLPLPPDASAERVAYILQDCQCKLLLVDEAFNDSLLNVPEVPVVKVQQLVENNPVVSENPGVIHTAADPAYIMYTSGTTGRPKGVKIQHQALMNFLTSMADKPGISEADTLLALSGYTFDISILEFFLPLLHGATLVIAAKEEVENINAFKKVVDKHTPTIIQATPSLLSLLIQNGWTGAGNLKLLCGGESLNKELAKNLLPCCRELWNMYGPTETTIWSAIQQIQEPVELVTVGRPINNTLLYVLDNIRQLVPPGIEADVYIGGDGLAAGYINQHELTAQKFISNPYDSSSRLYATGDTGYWTTAGELCIVGRKDNQVKLRGHRIELGEIESNLVEYGIKTARAVIRGEGHDKYIAVYYEAAVELDETAIKNFLRQRLLPVMMPSFITRVDKLPLTLSGKLDARRLPDPKYYQPATDNEELSVLEQQLVAIVKESLGIDKVSRLDDLFRIGINSILAIQVISKIERTLGVKLSLKTIFEYHHIADLAVFIAAQQAPALLAIEPVAPSNGYTLSHMQQRFWILSQLEDASSAYNIFTGFTLSGALDVEKLRRAFAMLIERHEVLRTHFVWEDEGIVQQVYAADQSDFAIEYTRFSDNGHTANRIGEIIAGERLQPFVFAEHHALFRVKLLQVAAEKHLLLFTIHHIICDARSLIVILNELTAFYFSLTGGRHVLPEPLPFQFKDYAAWEKQLLSSAAIAIQRRYWNDQFSGNIPLLKLRTDFAMPETPLYRGDILDVQLPLTLTENINRFVQQQQCSVFMFLFASVNLLLHKYTRQEDIVIGIPVSLRTQPGMEHQVGPYINTLAVRTVFSEQHRMIDFMQHTRQQLLNAFEHQEYPFDLLLDELNVPVMKGRSPLFDVMVSFQHIANSSLYHEQEDLVFESLDVKNNKSQFMLAIDFFEVNGSIRVIINYNIDLFKAISIEIMKERLVSLMQQMIATPGARLTDYDADSYLVTSEVAKEKMAFDY